MTKLARASFRERIERAEEARHSPLATPSYPARRLREEPDSDHRTPFQRDRDRIVHSKAFRRLKHKTQVFIAPEGDHYRTRLTHTLETCGIARTVARALGLNEDLTEAIGLGPRPRPPAVRPRRRGGARRSACASAAGTRFRHNEHSLRMVDEIERDSTSPSRCATASCTTPGPSRRPRSRAGSCGWSTGSPTSTTTSTTRSAPACCASRSCRAPRSSCSARPARSGSRRSCATCSSAPSEAGDIVQGEEVGGAMLRLREFMFERVYLGPEAQRAEAAHRAACCARCSTTTPSTRRPPLTAGRARRAARGRLSGRA